MKAILILAVLGITYASPRRSGPFQTSGNVGVPLPRRGLSQEPVVSIPIIRSENIPSSSSQTASSPSGTSFGVPLPVQSPSQSPSATLPLLANQDRTPLASNQNVPLLNTAQVSPGRPLPISNPTNGITSTRTSSNQQQFIVKQESAEDALSTEFLLNPLLRSIEERDDDLFSRELSDDDDDDDRIAQISLGRRFHPLGIPRRKNPNIILPSDTAARQTNSPFIFSNPHIKKPNEARFVFDDSVEIDDDFDDDDDDDRKIIVNLSPSVRAFNHETSEEKLFLDLDTLNGYNFVDTKGAVNWGYKTNDQYQEHVVNNDGTMEGAFGWTAPEGSEVSIKYIADKGGYKVISSTGAFQQEAPDVLAERERHFQAHARALSRLNPDAFTETGGVEISQPVVTPFDNVGSIGVSLPINGAIEPSGRIESDGGFVTIENQNEFPLLINNPSIDTGVRQSIGVSRPVFSQDVEQPAVEIPIPQMKKEESGIRLPFFVEKENLQGGEVAFSQNNVGTSPPDSRIGVPIPTVNQAAINKDTGENSFPSDLSNIINNIESGINADMRTSIGVPIPTSFITSGIEENVNRQPDANIGMTVPDSIGVELPMLKTRMETKGNIDSTSDNTNANEFGVQLPVQLKEQFSIDQPIVSNPTPLLNNVNIGVPIPKFSTEEKVGRADSEKIIPEQSILLKENRGSVLPDKTNLLSNVPTILESHPSFGVKLPTTSNLNTNSEHDPTVNLIIPKIPINNKGVGVPIPSIEDTKKVVTKSEIEILPSVQTVQGQNEITPIAGDLKKISVSGAGIPLPSKIDSTLETKRIKLSNIVTGIPLPSNTIDGSESDQTLMSKTAHGSSLQPKADTMSKNEKNQITISATGIPLPTQVDTASKSEQIKGAIPVFGIPLSTKTKTPSKGNQIIKSNTATGIPIPTNIDISFNNDQTKLSSTATGIPLPENTVIISEKVKQLPASVSEPVSTGIRAGVNIPVQKVSTSSKSEQSVKSNIATGIPLPANIDKTSDNVQSKPSLTATGIPLPDKSIIMSDNSHSLSTNIETGVRIPVKRIKIQNEIKGAPIIIIDQNQLLTKTKVPVSNSDFVAQMPITIITGVKIPVLETSKGQNEGSNIVKSDRQSVFINNVGVTENNGQSPNRFGVQLPSSDILSNLLTNQAKETQPSISKSEGVKLQSFQSDITKRPSPVSKQPIGSIGISIPSFPSEKIEAPSSTIIGGFNVHNQKSEFVLPNLSSRDSRLSNAQLRHNVGVRLPHFRENVAAGQLDNQNSFNNLLRLSRSSQTHS